MNVLTPQVEKYKDSVEIVMNDAGRSMSTGAKRNSLKHNCTGEYFCFIDCDDIVPMYYVDEILKAIELNPDVVTFIGYMTTNGGNRQNFTIKLGSEYVERNNHYYRFPNHLCVFKSEVVKSVQFPDLWVQEDYHFAKTIRDRKLLNSEVHIQKDMYHYDFRSNKPKNEPTRLR